MTPPSKLLITSRHKTYKGDFPVEVVGMEEAEAIELLRLEVRACHCEPRLTDAIALRIIKATGAAPYAMKLAVAQLAQHPGQFDSMIKSSLRREDVLDALFGRSYECLGEDAQFLYHLVGAIGKPTPEVVLDGILDGLSRDFVLAAEETKGYSLLQSIEDRNGLYLLKLAHVAQFHADRELVGHPDELQIKEEAKEMRGLIHREAGQVTARFFMNAVSRLRQTDVGSVQESELLRLCERCATSDPAKWLTLANNLQSALTPDIVRDYFRKAVQADPSDASAWKKWAMFERESGDELQSLYKNIRAIEVGGGDLAFCGRVAVDLLRLMRESEMKDRFPPHRRSALSGALRHQLTQHTCGGSLRCRRARQAWLALPE